MIDQVIDRMKYVLGVEHDVQLARALGVAQNVISGWKRRSSVPWQTLLKLHDEYGVCLNWLVLGQPSLDYAYQYPPIETKAIPYRGAEGLEEIMWKWGLNMAISPGWDHSGTNCRASRERRGAMSPTHDYRAHASNG